MGFSREFSLRKARLGLFLGLVFGLGLAGAFPGSLWASTGPARTVSSRSSDDSAGPRVERTPAAMKGLLAAPSGTTPHSGTNDEILDTSGSVGNTGQLKSSGSSSSGRLPSVYLVQKEGFWGGVGVLAALAVWAGLLLWNIRRRKNAEESLRQSEERLRLALEGSQDALWDWNVATGKYIVDERWCAMLGYAKSEIDEHIEQWATLVHRDDLLTITGALTECMEGRASHFSGEFRMWAKSGQWKWILSRGKVVARDREGRPVRLAGTHRDISRDKETEQALKEALTEAEQAKDKIDSILKSIADGLIVSGLDKRIVLMNRQAESLLGVTHDQALGHPVDSLLRESSFCDHLSAFMIGKTEMGSVDLEIFDHGRKEVRIIHARTCLARNKEGERTGVITTLQDVTQAREMERIKSEFVSTAAHELRTPLTAIMGYAELLLPGKGFGAEERRQFLSVIYEKAQGLEKIVDELLDLSRIESGRLISLEKSTCDLNNLAASLLEQFRKVSLNHRFESLLPDERIAVLVDKGKIGQVLENLLSNAVKYSPHGGRIRLTVNLTEEECRICVEDEGIGMTPEQVARVFDKFYRANFADAAVRGLGLGMTIVKSIVEAHSGRIWVESEPARGTKVTFTLPKEQPFKEDAEEGIADNRAADSLSAAARPAQ